MNPIKKLLLGKNYVSAMNTEREQGSRWDDKGYARWRSENQGESPRGPRILEREGGCNPPRRDILPEGEYDRGNERTVINLDNSAEKNENYRTALWTGENMQLTVMSIPIGGQTGEELHEREDQLIKITSGLGEVYFPDPSGELVPSGKVTEEFAVIIPRGVRHNLKNIGNKPLKLYSVYSPPHHPYGTVEKKQSKA